jgi:thermolysin metallopeptidase-like protein/fungalysin/thermolysin propeptide
MAARVVAICVLLLLVAGAASAGGLEALSDKGSGRLFALRVTPMAPVPGAFAARPAPTSLRATADGFIAEHRELIGIEDPERDLVVTPATTDQLGLSRVKYFQTHHGLDVLGGEIAVHLNRDGQVSYVKTKVARELPADVTPRFTEAQAQDAALDAAVAEGASLGSLMTLRRRLLVLPLGMIRNEPSNASYLAWEVEVADAETGGERFSEGYYYDAISGAPLIQLTRILRYTPITRQIYDCGGGTGSTCWLDVESTSYPGYYHGRTEGMPARGQYPDPAVPVFYGSGDVDSLYDRLRAQHDYYSTTFGIDGANGHGGAADWPSVPWHITRGVAHNDLTGFTPACPGGAYLSRNTGTTTYCRGMIVHDTVGHEYAHGVVHHSYHDGNGEPIGLVYFGQTGSLDEGYADFMGAILELASSGQTDWISGTGTGYTRRDLADPPSALRWDADNLPYPARFYDPNFYCGGADAAGAHMNLTVPGHAFYLIAMGGVRTGCQIAAQGVDVAQQVWFRGWRTYFSGSVSFNEAYVDLIQACNDLYAPSVCAEVTKALQAVELDQPGACSGSQETPPPCSVVGVTDLPAPAIEGIRLLSENPASGLVRFAYRTAHEGRVEARIHDLVGRLLARPFRAYQLAGEQIGAWDGGLDGGERAKAGAYFLSITLDGQSIGLRKLLVLQ